MPKIIKEEKRFTKRAILLNYAGIKKDVLKAILSENENYTLSEVEDKYNEFLKGGK